MSLLKISAAALLLASQAAASPVAARAESTSATSILSVPESTNSPDAEYDWSKDWQTHYQIHHSCNATQRHVLEDALSETVKMAGHARDHLLAFGHESDFVVKYFGNGSTATPIGWYDRVIGANKEGVLFRCDDPDENCATQDQWAGHWRGSNATSETVICDRSFQPGVRAWLNDMCGNGYTVANSPTNTFWATDLLHRVLHVPNISEGLVEHYAEDYPDALRQAEEEPEKSGVDSDVLQMFAVDVYAYDIANPGEGCTGKFEGESAADKKKDDKKASSTASAEASKTSSSNAHCHTHDDGFVHC